MLEELEMVEDAEPVSILTLALMLRFVIIMLELGLTELNLPGRRFK
jgi:hypothetical protein